MSRLRAAKECLIVCTCADYVLVKVLECSFPYKEGGYECRKYELALFTCTVSGLRGSLAARPSPRCWPLRSRVAKPCGTEKV